MHVYSMKFNVEQKRYRKYPFFLSPTQPTVFFPKDNY